MPSHSVSGKMGEGFDFWVNLWYHGRMKKNIKLWLLKGDAYKEIGTKVPAGPDGWPPAYEIADVPDRPVIWWTRWILRYSYVQAYHRLVTCRKEHRGPMYDGYICLTCGKELK